MARTLVYRPNPGGRWLPIVVVGLLAFGSVPFLAAMLILDNGPSPSIALLLFAVFWVVLVWNAYWWLLRIAHRVTFDGRTIMWATPLRRGAVDLDDVESIERWRLAGSAIRIADPDVRRPVMLVAAKGLVELLDAIAAARPDLRVDRGRLPRLVERLPGASRLRRTRR